MSLKMMMLLNQLCQTRCIKFFTIIRTDEWEKFNAYSYRLGLQVLIWIACHRLASLRFFWNVHLSGGQFLVKGDYFYVWNSRYYSQKCRQRVKILVEQMTSMLTSLKA